MARKKKLSRVAADFKKRKTAFETHKIETHKVVAKKIKNKTQEKRSL